MLGARPRTLPAAVAPVVVGTAAAAGVCSGIDGSEGAVDRFSLALRCAKVAGAGSGSADEWLGLVGSEGVGGVLKGLHVWSFLCALGVAVFVQIATNYANDYSDGKRGTDDPGSRVGPPRLVGNGLATPGEVKRAMLICFALTAVSGLPLVIWLDWRLIFVGVAAIAAGWFYTGGPRPYGYAGFGEVFVFVFFGLVATAGSFYVQTLSLSLLAIGCGVAMGCFATALLVVNNLRDIPGDTAVGKTTLAVRLGERNTRTLYVVLLVVPMLMVPFIAGGSGRLLAALALLALLPARRAVTDVLTGARGAALIPALARTGQVQVVYAGLLAAGLFVSS